MFKADFEKLGGLIPAIAQDYETGEVLMLAFMDSEALRLTVDTGEAHYFSRSRGRIWKKGESSGHVQIVKEIRFDCDMDAVLIKVDQKGGAACHDGFRSCFYRLVSGDNIVDKGVKIFNPEKVYGK